MWILITCYLFKLTAKMFIGEKVLPCVNVYVRELIAARLTLCLHTGGGHT